MHLTEKIIILGHENPDVDSIVSGYLLQQMLTKKSIPAEFIIPDQNIEQESSNICLSYGLNPYQFQKQIDLTNKFQKFILVDHQKRNLSGETLAIIDHHLTDEKVECKNYFNKISSSTSCIICQNNEEYFSDFELELAFLAAFVDTASFHSTKGRESDRKWIEKYCKILSIDYNKLYKEGLCLTSLDDLKKASLNGLKKYNFNGLDVQSSYIQVENTEEEKRIIETIIEYLKNYVLDNNLEAFVFIVHDMTKFNSKVYQISKIDIIERKYNKYTSRGNTIMPEVSRSLKKIKRI